MATNQTAIESESTQVHLPLAKGQSEPRRVVSGLDINKMLIAEYQYIAQTAFQANEDRARVSNYYIITTAAGVASIVGAKLDIADATLLNRVYLGFTALFGTLSLLGLLTVLILARLSRSKIHGRGAAIAESSLTEP